MLSPVCIPIGSTFSMLHTVILFPSESLITSYSNSPQPTTLFSISTCFILLSLIPVLVGSVLATVVWAGSPLFDPLWRALFTVFTWVFGFAAGTRLFWSLILRIQNSKVSQ